MGYRTPREWGVGTGLGSNFLPYISKATGICQLKVANSETPILSLPKCLYYSQPLHFVPLLSLPCLKLTRKDHFLPNIITRWIKSILSSPQALGLCPLKPCFLNSLWRRTSFSPSRSSWTSKHATKINYLKNETSKIRYIKYKFNIF